MLMGCVKGRGGGSKIQKQKYPCMFVNRWDVEVRLNENAELIVIEHVIVHVAPKPGHCVGPQGQKREKDRIVHY